MSTSSREASNRITSSSNTVAITLLPDNILHHRRLITSSSTDMVEWWILAYHDRAQRTTAVRLVCLHAGCGTSPVLAPRSTKPPKTRKFPNLVLMTPRRYQQPRPPSLQNLSHDPAIIGLTLHNVRYT